MDRCLFCQIVKKQIPAITVYEDKDFMAFLDIYPKVYGHTLVIPKKHYRWVYDVKPYTKYWQLARQIGLAALRAFNARWISFMTVGEEVPHAHIHVLPRTEADHQPAVVNFSKIVKLSRNQLKAIAIRLKQEMGGV